jgi:PEP-CTERM motif
MSRTISVFAPARNARTFFGIFWPPLEELSSADSHRGHCSRRMAIYQQPKTTLDPVKLRFTIRNLFWLALSVALTLTDGARAFGALAVVDQQYLPSQWITSANVGASGTIDWSQTFTVGISGQLTGVDVAIERLSVVQQPLLYDIRRTAGGVPTSANSGVNVLATGSISAESVPIVQNGTKQLPSLTHLDISGSDILVTAGDILAIVLRSNDPGGGGALTYEWHGTRPGDPYDRGSAFVRDRFSQPDQWVAEVDNVPDLEFSTQVAAVPEPASLILILSGLGLICAVKRAIGK